MYYNYKLSDETLNNKGFIIETAGIQLEQFNNNPVALHNHNLDVVVGKWENVRINEENNTELIGTLVFDYSDPKSQELMNQVSKDLIKHVSIGIELVDGYEDEIDGKPVIVVTECILKEASITPLPANKNAVKLYYNGESINDSTDLINNYQFNNINKNEMSKIVELTDKVSTLETKVSKTELKLNDVKQENNTLKSNIVLKDSELLTLKEKVTELETKLVEIDKEKETAKFNDLLDEAITEGKITEGQKENFIKLSYDNAKLIIEGLESKEIKPEIKLTDRIKKPGETKTKEDKDFRWFEKNDPTALKLMYNEDKESYDKLYNNFYNKK